MSPCLQKFDKSCTSSVYFSGIDKNYTLYHAKSGWYGVTTSSWKNNRPVTCCARAGGEQTDTHTHTHELENYNIDDTLKYTDILQYTEWHLTFYTEWHLTIHSDNNMQNEILKYTVTTYYTYLHHKMHRIIKSTMQLQSSLTCGDVVKKKCGNSNCQSDTYIHQTFVQDRGPWRWGGGGGIPRNEREAVEYLQKKILFCSFALSEVSFLKLSKTVTEYEHH